MTRFGKITAAGAVVLGAALPVGHTTARAAPVTMTAGTVADAPTSVAQAGYHGRRGSYRRGYYGGGWGGPVAAGAALGLFGAAAFGGYGPVYSGRPYGYHGRPYYRRYGYARPYHGGYGYYGRPYDGGYGFYGPRW